MGLSHHYIEWRNLGDKSLSWDIAHHLYVRQFQGPVIIITAKPNGLLPAVRKQWQKVARQAQLERAKTTKTTRVTELIRDMAHMQKLGFTVRPKASLRDTDVLFVTAEAASQLDCRCHTIYITISLDTLQLRILESMVQEHGLFVMYQKT